mmetsp:Transcript_11187/g.25442  ORF Transcript_11187/g.25442 Transcript_11187/m.25442 type:complete len:647 (-) Transcript_11187:59-1999(-)
MGCCSSKKKKKDDELLSATPNGEENREDPTAGDDIGIVVSASINASDLVDERRLVEEEPEVLTPVGLSDGEGGHALMRTITERTEALSSTVAGKNSDPLPDDYKAEDRPPLLEEPSLRSLKRQATHELYLDAQPEKAVPSVGGLVHDLPVSDNVLPIDVLLHVPSKEEVFIHGNRMIFLNTPLTDKEEDQITRLDNAYRDQGKSVPRCMLNSRLRAMQQAKGDVKKAMHILDTNYDVRLQRMPVRESEVANDLRRGVLYWHGRDKCCRPVLVIRTANMDKEMVNSTQRITRLCTFQLEYMIRYGLYPGRVENWAVIVDMADAGHHGKPSVAFLKAIADALQNGYRYRMVWAKIVNVPWWFSGLWQVCKGFVPGDSIKKVEIMSSGHMKSLQDLFVPSQLEKRFGGTAENVEGPDDFYPPRFLASSCTDSDLQLPASSTLQSHRLHSGLSRSSMEGSLWTKQTTAEWLPLAKHSLLTATASNYVQEKCGYDFPACVNIEDLQKRLEALQEEEAEAASPLATVLEPKDIEPINDKVDAGDMLVKAELYSEPTADIRAASSGPLHDAEIEEKENIWVEETLPPKAEVSHSHPPKRGGGKNQSDKDLPEMRMRMNDSDSRPAGEATIFDGCAYQWNTCGVCSAPKVSRRR